MNANRIIDMIVRQVMRRLVTRGVDKGFEVAGRMSQKNDGSQSNKKPVATSGQQNNIRQAQRVARQMRRFIRF